MTFQWPWMLGALVLLPVLVVGYRRLRRRRLTRHAALASMGLVAPAAPPGRRRLVAPSLLLAALTLLLVALARPQATVAEPRREGTVILAFDVSNSMAATDVAPSRIAAAKAAARTFVQRQPSTIQIGVVAFSDSGFIAQRPTTERQDVLAAIDRLTPQGGTALARGIQTSLSAIAGKTVELDAPSENGGGPAIGFYGNAAVVLLSDGENTDKTDPADAAQLASVAGVKIYPIGLGSPAGTVLQIDGFQVATALDETTLRSIAQVTGGRYFAARDSQELQKVYGSIDLQWVAHLQHTEITALFAGAAALLLLIGSALSLTWFGRVV